VTILQPGLPSPQDVVHLRSQWAYAANDQTGVERILLIFPLPGAKSGDRQFFLYLRVPGKRSRPISVGDPLPAGGQVGGFLIQAKGRLAGKTFVTQGTVELSGQPFDSGKYRLGKLNLFFADGSMVDGEFRAKVAPLDVRDFEDAKAGDIRELLGRDRQPPGATQSAPSGAKP